MTLKGVGYKESGCYYRESVSNLRSHHRMSCFPFIEDHEVSSWRSSQVHDFHYGFLGFHLWRRHRVLHPQISSSEYSQTVIHHSLILFY